MKTSAVKMKSPAETGLLEKWLKNIQAHIVSSLKLLSVEEQQSLLALTDDNFWFEAQLKARTQQIISTPTPEKQSWYR